MELLAATTLGAVLICAVLAMLSSVTKHKQQLSEREPESLWKSLLYDQLRQDLTNSRKIAAGTQQLRMVGFASRDFFSGAMTHRPAEISYQIASTNLRYWLMRTERHLDDLSNQNARASLVASGIKSLTIESVEEDGTLRAITGNERLAAGQGQAVPARIRILLVSDRDDRPLFDRTFVLR